MAKRTFKEHVDRLIEHVKKEGPRIFSELAYELNISPNYVVMAINTALAVDKGMRYEELPSDTRSSKYIFDIKDQRVLEKIERQIADHYKTYHTDLYMPDWARGIILAKEKATGTLIPYWRRPEDPKWGS